jgi:hypothetical protein
MDSQVDPLLTRHPSQLVLRFHLGPLPLARLEQLRTRVRKQTSLQHQLASQLSLLLLLVIRGWFRATTPYNFLHELQRSKSVESHAQFSLFVGCDKLECADEKEKNGGQTHCHGFHIDFHVFSGMDTLRRVCGCADSSRVHLCLSAFNGCTAE